MRHALVTGSAGGIGGAAVLAFEAAGFTVTGLEALMQSGKSLTYKTKAARPFWDRTAFLDQTGLAAARRRQASPL